VPNGDVVQRVYTVADAGGLTVVEVENESTLPVAIAFDRRGVLTERPISDTPVEGLSLPSEAFVLPLGHAARLRVAIAHRSGGGGLPAGLPTHLQVVRGWTATAERASRLVLPDSATGAVLAEEVTAIRCELALGTIARSADDPVAYAIGLGELVRMGEPPEHWIPELVDAVAAVGPVTSWDADVALAAADRVLLAAGERRARRDLARIVARRTTSARPALPPDGVRAIPWLEGMLAVDRALLPAGLPTAWLGQPLECYGVPTRPGSSVSYAIRWHGPRPAVLWEQSGPPVTLTAPAVAPAWTTDEPTGEALWPPPEPPEPPELPELPTSFT
jgi:hypothetical protein